MFVILSKILVFIFLLINTVTDIKHKKIWFPLSILVLVLGIIMHLLVPGMHPVQSLAGMIPGLLLLGIYRSAAMPSVPGTAFPYVPAGVCWACPLRSGLCCYPCFLLRLWLCCWLSGAKQTAGHGFLICLFCVRLI